MPVDNLWINRSIAKQQKALSELPNFWGAVEKSGTTHRAHLRSPSHLGNVLMRMGFAWISPHGKKRVAKPASDATLAGVSPRSIRSGSTLAAAATISSGRSPPAPSLRRIGLK